MTYWIASMTNCSANTIEVWKHTLRSSLQFHFDESDTVTSIAEVYNFTSMRVWSVTSTEVWPSKFTISLRWYILRTKDRPFSLKLNEKSMGAHQANPSISLIPRQSFILLFIVIKVVYDQSGDSKFTYPFSKAISAWDLPPLLRHQTLCVHCLEEHVPLFFMYSTALFFFSVVHSFSVEARIHCSHNVSVCVWFDKKREIYLTVILLKKTTNSLCWYE